MAKSVEEKAAAKAAKGEEKAAATKAVVLSSTGGHIRTYDVDTHGEDFAELAQEFVGHMPGATVQLL